MYILEIYCVKYEESHAYEMELIFTVSVLLSKIIPIYSISHCNCLYATLE